LRSVGGLTQNPTSASFSSPGAMIHCRPR
jgi:hypothetical protein